MTEYAPGIPSKKTKHPLPSIKKPRVLEFGIHHHFSEGAAKEHFDLRIGDPSTGHAHSWAMKYLPKPGEARLAVQQPTHTLEYMSWAGRIESGYGKGDVKLHRREKTEILSSSDDHVRFNLYPSNRVEEYLLRRTDGDKWLLHNITTTRETKAGKEIPDAKPKYRSTEPGKLDVDKPGTVLQAKVDGAHVIYQFKEPGSLARVFSYRPSARETGLIEHTHRLDGFHEHRASRDLANTVLRGELYAAKPSGDALDAARVGGILNANVWKSREKQKTEGALVPVVFDVLKWRGKDVSGEPYAKRLELLQKATEAAPWLKTPRMASSSEEKAKLIEDIRQHKEPSTVEGVIEWDLVNNKPPVKAKFRNEEDVYVREVFAERGSRTLAGGFAYSRSPTGPIVGRVGTGFSQNMKKDMLENPDKYKGLKMVIKTQRGQPGRAPVFHSFHLDQELPASVKLARWQSFETELFGKLAMQQYEAFCRELREILQEKTAVSLDWVTSRVRSALPNTTKSRVKDFARRMDVERGFLLSADNPSKWQDNVQKRFAARYVADPTRISVLETGRGKNLERLRHNLSREAARQGKDLDPDKIRVAKSGWPNY